LSKNFAWVIDSQLLPFAGGNGGISPQYVLPRALAPDPVSSLAGSRIWMVAKSRDGLFAFANIFVQQVDEFEEGYSAGDYLITSDIWKSFRVFSTLRDAEKYRLDGIGGTGGSLLELSDENNAVIAKRVMDTIPKSFSEPSALTIDKVKAPHVRKGAKLTYARDQLAKVIASIPVADTYFFKGRPELPPFANLAYHRISKDIGKQYADEALETLKELDPIPAFVTPSSPVAAATSGEATPAHVPAIDLNLQAIDPNNIYARKFIAKAGFVDTTAKMLKTESAEKEHQEMLRDIAAFLLSSGHVPLQSSSIDLLVETTGGDNLFEIKSANAINIIHQAAKGVFQLISYAIALEEEGRTVKSNAMILGCSGNAELNAFVDSVVTKAGLRCLFYKRNEEWPKRVPGLLQLVLS